MGKKKKKEVMDEGVRLYIAKGIRLIFWGNLIGLLGFIPNTVHGFITSFVPAHLVSEFILIVPTFVILYGLFCLRNVNRYLQVSFIMSAVSSAFTLLTVVDVFYLSSFEQVLIVVGVISLTMSMVSSFAIYLGFALLFKDTLPRLSKGFKRLIWLNIISVFIVFGVGGIAGAEAAAIILLFVLISFALYEIHLLHLAYKHLTVPSARV